MNTEYKIQNTGFRIGTPLTFEIYELRFNGIGSEPSVLSAAGKSEKSPESALIGEICGYSAILRVNSRSLVP